MARSAELGQEQWIDLPQGRLRYFERGTGRPLVFVHGLLVNPELWRNVVAGAAEAGFRCLAPELPLGSHETPMNPGADLTPPGQAKLIADFLAALDLHDVTLVANDTGGALTQLVMTRHAERVGRVVLTPSDCFDLFPPPLFRGLVLAGRLPGGLWLVAALTRLRFLHRTPFVFGHVTKRPIPRASVAAYLDPLWQNRAIRRDLRKFLLDMDPKYTRAAADALPGFGKPVLLAWASEDKLFPLSLAYRLAELLPDVEVVEIADSYAFVPEDQPAELVKHIVRFAGVMAD
jgi:pimeloyl-ACP methyl ester carboxylesterase